MSLAQIVFPPPTETGLEEWAHAHFQHHIALLNGVEQRYGIRFPSRLIYPINIEDPAATQIFLSEHQSMHSDIGGLLGIQGNDLANVDFSDDDQRKSWFFLNLQFHRSAAESLGLGI